MVLGFKGCWYPRGMRAEIFTLCEAATATPNGLNILGTFDAIASRAFPASHPFCAVALKVRFNPGEAGSHRFEINLFGPDMAPVFEPIIWAPTIETPPDKAPVAHWISWISPLPLPKPGEYELQLLADGDVLHNCPFYVHQSK